MSSASVAEPAAEVGRQAVVASESGSSDAAARACDRALDVAVVAFAAWTAVYDVCVVLRVRAVWAPVAWIAALGALAWLFRRLSAADLEPSPDGHARPLGAGTRRRLVIANRVTAVVAGLVFAFTSLPWAVVWSLWLIAAGCAVACFGVRGIGRVADTRASNGAAATGSSRRLEHVVVGVWAVGLAALPLFLVNTDSDDAQYVHLSTWIAAHDTFPLRDVMFSNQGFPALYFPPASSFEALVGTLASLSSEAVPTIVYLVVPALGGALCVLALWRLLRAWGVRAISLAISVTFVFLLFDAVGRRHFGPFFFTRIWQGKALFVAVFVPILFALLHEYAERPTRRRTVLLACAGVAGVGLSTTGLFVVPVIAAGCLAALFVRSFRFAARGLAATAAYPASAAVVSLALGGRVPDVTTAHYIRPANLAGMVLGGGGVMTALAVTAILAAPPLLDHARAGQMVAVTMLAVGCLLAPELPALIWRATRLGQELWRLLWSVPVGALVGVLASSAVTGRPRVVRGLPAVAAVAGVVLAGRPVWSPAAGTTVAMHPVWKRPPDQIAAARSILGVSRPGDVVLAPRGVSETLLVMAGKVTTVSPRPLYTRALARFATGHARERLMLRMRVAQSAPPRTRPGAWLAAHVRPVRAALRAVGVDLACVGPANVEARRMLVKAGYSLPVDVVGLACVRRPGHR